LWIFYPIKTTYLIVVRRFFAGSKLVFFSKTSDYLTAVKLSWYSFPDEVSG